MLHEYYPWLKAFHIMAVIAWVSVLLYLPRLFVYHCEVAPDSEAARILGTMERRLLGVIGNPAMIATWTLGILLLFAGTTHGGWLGVKFLAVLGLTGYYMLLARWRRLFAAGRNSRSPRFYRIINEVPSVLVVIIVLAVVLKPF